MLHLYQHPLAMFCHKVLIPLYEVGTPFESHEVDLMSDTGRARHLDLWPVGKIPVLHDDATGKTLPETSIIIEYLDRHYPGPEPMLPEDPDLCLDVRLWDRLFDSYVSVSVQKIVIDRLRAEGDRDPAGAREARDQLHVTYGMIDRKVEGRTWIAGDAFTLADASAASALFYAGILEPFSGHPHLSAYFERLLERPSFRRVLKEASPWFGNFPYYEAMPDRFKALSNV